MSASPLRLLRPVLRLTDPVSVPAVVPATAPVRLRDEGRDFLRFLVQRGLVPAHHMVEVLQGDRRSDHATLLLSQGIVADPPFTAARATWHGLPLIDPILHKPDVRLIDRLGPYLCLRGGLLPWRSIGGVTIVLADRPDAILRHRDALEAAFGRIAPALAPRAAIEAAIGAARHHQFKEAAETRTRPEDSCRTLPPLRLAPVVAGLMIAVLLCVIAPGGLAGLLTLLALATMMLSLGLKFAALMSAIRRPDPATAPPAVIVRLPVVSVIVALYREADIAARLVHRLGRLDYPRDRLDVVLAVEEDDVLTRIALAQAGLPPWMRMIVVPHGALKTKPRALNYALDFCRGSIVGIYDAEDAPDPGQIGAIVERFHQRGPQVACLQGVLDFYNPRTNWLARCFTLEYAAWFRVLLPGLDRLGLPIPLGGTTLFFRRAALEDLGGWDAHNVTEDADLGMRLYRRGYRTELVATVTDEEANCRAWPWIKQRSRWIKGYMMTWRVHMRDPARLWRELGPKGFAAFQILILGSVGHALLAPVLLSYWAVALGLPHPLAGALPPIALVALVGMFLTCAAVNLTINMLALRLTRHRFNPLWLLALGLYHPLATLAAWKALWELVRRPFYWDKTQHGKFDPPI